jgi:hypothetical protein
VNLLRSGVFALSRHAVRKFRARFIALAGAVLMFAGVSCGNSVEPQLTGGIKVLFIGNSLTYVNNLPGTISALALTAGDTIQVRMVAEPNFALIDHYVGGSNALGEIAGGGWNFVVLQQGPSTTPINRDSLILTAKLFEPHIKAVGATPALYMVWPTIDRVAFFDAARVSYQMAATEVDGVFLPAGRAWVTAWESDANLSLYDSDGLHPSPLGTYLAALVIYERLTGHDARQLPGTAVVDGRTLNTPEATVRLLQRAAHETNALYPP